jgi:hypothetical protein
MNREQKMLTMCAVPVQKPDARWTKRPFDICLSLYHPPCHGASQTEIRQIGQGLSRFFHLHEWHWWEWRDMCLQEPSHRSKT